MKEYRANDGREVMKVLFWRELTNIDSKKKMFEILDSWSNMMMTRVQADEILSSADIRGGCHMYFINL